MSININVISKGYRVPVIDYERTGESSLLISSGSGIMLSLMDELPHLRYCVDIDEIINPEHRLADWMQWMGRLADQILIVGWFGLGNPKYLLEGLDMLPERRCITYLPLIEYDRHITTKTLKDFLDKSKERHLAELLNRYLMDKVITEGSSV